MNDPILKAAHTIVAMGIAAGKREREMITDMTYDRLLEAGSKLTDQIKTKDAEIARLQKALTDIAAIPHMGQYTGSRVNAAIAASKPWSM